MRATLLILKIGIQPKGNEVYTYTALQVVYLFLEPVVCGKKTKPSKCCNFHFNY